MQESCRPNHSIDVPTVSILIPCYNVAVTVNVAVASLLGQTLPEHEIVAVDDSSTDTTGDHLAKWAGAIHERGSCPFLTGDYSDPEHWPVVLAAIGAFTLFTLPLLQPS